MKLFTQILAYLNLAESGLASASTYALYRPLIEKNYTRINILMSTISRLYDKIFLFILISGGSLSLILPFIMNEKSLSKEIYLYWIIYVISTAIGYKYIKYNILLIADQKFRIVRLIQGGSKIICQFLQIIILLRTKSFFYFTLILILDNLLQYLLYKLYYKYFYSYILKVNLIEKKIIKDMKNLFIHKLATVVVFNTDIILISRFISIEMIGIYASYQMILQILKILINIIIETIRPRIGGYIAQNSKTEIFELWKQLNILFLYISLFVVSVTYNLVNDFMKLWFSKDVLLSNNIIFLMMINFFIECFRKITDIFKEGSGFFEDIHLAIIEALINLIFSIMLVKKLGLTGVISGTIISNIIVVLILKPLLVFRKCFGKSLSMYIKIYSKYLGLILISIVVFRNINIYSNFINIENWLDWLNKAIIISIMDLICLTTVFFMNKEFRKSLKLLRNKL